MTKITTKKISFLQVISKPLIRKTNSFAEAEKVSHQKLCVNLAHAFSTRKHPNAKLYPNFFSFCNFLCSSNPRFSIA